MKQILTALAVAAVLVGPAAAWRIPHPKGPPIPPVTFVYCGPRTDGVDGYLCAERGDNPRAVALMYFEKTPTGLLGVRVPIKVRR